MYIQDRSVASGGFGGMGATCPAPSKQIRAAGGCCLTANLTVSGQQQCCGPAFPYLKVVKVGTKYRLNCGTKTGPGSTNTQPPSDTGGGGATGTDTTSASAFDFSSILSGPYLTYGIYIIGGIIVFKIVKGLLASRSSSSRMKKNFTRHKRRKKYGYGHRWKGLARHKKAFPLTKERRVQRLTRKHYRIIGPMDYRYI